LLSNYRLKIIEREQKVARSEQNAKKIEWVDEWSIGNDLLDQHHRAIIKYINLLNDLSVEIQNGVSVNDSAVQNVLDKLIAYTVFHFDAEEPLLKRYNYIGLAKHHEIHQHLITQLNHLQDRLKDIGLSLVPILIEFLNTWLKDHILGVDMKYKPIVGKRDRP